MSCVYSTGAYHRALSAQHTAFEHRYGFSFLAPLEVKDHLAQAHTGESACRASRAAGAAGHTFVYVRFHIVDLFKFFKVSPVQVDR